MVFLQKPSIESYGPAGPGWGIPRPSPNLELNGMRHSKLYSVYLVNRVRPSRVELLYYFFIFLYLFWTNAHSTKGKYIRTLWHMYFRTAICQPCLSRKQSNKILFFLRACLAYVLSYKYKTCVSFLLEQNSPTIHTKNEATHFWSDSIFMHKPPR